MTGILERDGALLLVASRYRNHPRALWNLPGGRVRAEESLADALVREVREETGLAARVGALCYVSESFDGATRTRFVNTTFSLHAEGTPVAALDDTHVVELAFVPHDDLAARLTVAVVRDPLLAFLADPSRRYFAFADAGITIEFNDPA